MPLPASLRPLLRVTPTLAPVPNRALLYVHGSQATEFLNGVLASTVPNPPHGPFFSTFLTAQGRVIHDAFVYYKRNVRGHDGYLVEFDSRPSEAPSLLSTLKRFILRSKVKVEDVSNQYDVWSAWGSESTNSPRQWTHTRSGIIEPVWSSESSAEPPWSDGPLESLRLKDRRAPGMGRRLLSGRGDKPGEASTHDLASHDDYTLHRVLHGVPEGNVDIPPMQAFPMESNLDVMGGLDFRKGCYVGQELTVRTYHTGVLRKRILPVYLKHIGGQPSPESYSALQHSDVRPMAIEGSSTPAPRVRGTGKLLTTTSQGVGLALMRLDQVDLVEKGLLGFKVNPSLNVEHWWPDWWPKESSKDEDDGACTYMYQ